MGGVSLGTVFEVVGRTEEANLQLIDFIYVAEKEKEAAETQRKLAYGVTIPGNEPLRKHERKARLFLGEWGRVSVP